VKIEFSVTCFLFTGLNINYLFNGNKNPWKIFVITNLRRRMSVSGSYIMIKTMAANSI